MKYALIFILLSLACLVEIFSTSVPGIRLVCASAAVAFAGVGMAYARNAPVLLLKRGNGTMHAASFVLYWPYHLLNAVGLSLFRRGARESPFDQIGPMLYLGSRLTTGESHKIIGMGVRSVLDLTCELPEATPLRLLPHYRCLPLLDTQAPSEAQLRDAVVWLEARTQEGAVYVHCALGHGRSATLVAAYLLHTGQFYSTSEALQHLVRIRPGVGLSNAQRRVLETFIGTDASIQ